MQSVASATPTTFKPASRSSFACTMWTVLSATVANCIASSSARRLVSRPSKAIAIDRIGEGSPPHTITQRSAILISEATVGPRASPLVVTPRRPTSTASAVFASSASSTSACPESAVISTARPAAITRSRARSSIAGPSVSRPSGSFT